MFLIIWNTFFLVTSAVFYIQEYTVLRNEFQLLRGGHISNGYRGRYPTRTLLYGGHS